MSRMRNGTTKVTCAKRMRREKLMKQLLCLLTLIAIVNVTPARGMTIDEAYRAIPHKRTSYDAQLSTLGATERAFLARLFALSDEALVERVETLAALRKGNRAQLERYEVQVSRIISTLRTLPEPAS